jgi:hypothetical protein
LDFLDQPLPRASLTFEVVDDLVGAHSRGRLKGAPQVRYAATEICPLIELMMEASNGRIGPLLQTPWLDSITQLDLRAALASNQNIWLDETRRCGFMRTTFDPRVEADDLQRNRFLIAARTAAEAAGLLKPVAQCLAAAMREMESNIHEHCGAAATGILAFQARPSLFEFVAADCGAGVLATRRTPGPVPNGPHGSQNASSRAGANGGAHRRLALAVGPRGQPCGLGPTSDANNPGPGPGQVGGPAPLP